MTQAPLLLISGADALSHQTAHLLRATYLEVLLPIGGRDLAKAKALASELSQVQGVQLDRTAPDLGQRPLSVVAIC
ncbi:MAG: hypothetical protein ACRYG7_39660 [Janthinobacterium lividum]